MAHLVGHANTWAVICVHFGPGVKSLDWIGISVWILRDIMIDNEMRERSLPLHTSFRSAKHEIE